eukprot:6473245-Amphidinium_carterae.1
MDKRWKLDASYLNMLCSESVTCVISSEWISSCLPSTSALLSVTAAQSKSATIVDSPLFTWSASVVKADIKIAHQWLSKLASRRPPAASGIENDWLAKVWSSLPMFVHFLDGRAYFEEIPECWPEGKADEVQHGGSAVVALAERALAKKESEVTSADFELVGLFTHCLTPELMKKCDDRMNALAKSSSEGAVAIPPVVKGRTETVMTKGRKRKSVSDGDAGDKSLSALLGL